MDKNKAGLWSNPHPRNEWISSICSSSQQGTVLCYIHTQCMYTQLFWVCSALIESTSKHAVPGITCSVDLPFQVDLLRHKQVLLSVTNSLLTHQSKQNCVDQAGTYMESLHDKGGGGEGEGGGGGGGGRGGWSQFSEVFMVSALTGDGMGSLRVNLAFCCGQWEVVTIMITGPTSSF